MPILNRGVNQARSLVTFFLLVVSLSAHAQRQDGMAANATLSEFDVAAIRPDRDAMAARSSVNFSGDEFDAESAMFTTLVEYAFGVEHYQVRWKQSDLLTQRFTIKARLNSEQATLLGKLDEADATAARRRLVRNLLESRFGLETHEETVELPGYLLNVGKGGIRFTRSAAEDESDPALIKTPQMRMVGLGEIHAEKLPFSFFVDFLSSELGHQVVDQTGIKDAATFDLKWNSDSGGLLESLMPGASQTKEFSGAGMERGYEKQPGVADPPPLKIALEEQLGLTLTYGKSLQQRLVVDKAASPSPN